MSAADGSEVYNNLFSDLGPLISLFGDQFAQQFLSESFTTWDHIIFAMGPVGIITALIGAIRLGGPTWLRAIIGRARENRGGAEAELMSSTSHAVCELYNGESVVRQVGTPLVKQIVVLRDKFLDKDDKTFGLFTVESALGDGQMVSKAYDGPSIRDWLVRFVPAALVRRSMWLRQANWTAPSDPEKGSRKSSAVVNSDSYEDADEENGQADGKSKKYRPTKILKRFESLFSASRAKPRQKKDPRLREAPNILLNLHYSSKIGDLVFAALVGLVLQGGVVVYAGVLAYSPTVSADVLLHGEVDVAYGYPLLAVGTVLMTVGLVVSAAVIEESTEERQYRIPKCDQRKDPKSAMQVLWLQKQQFLGEHSFDSYLLEAEERCGVVYSSRRSEKLQMNINADEDVKLGKGTRSVFRSFAKNGLEWLTLTGVVLGLVGFILQFQGFRTVDWTCAIAQLGTTFTMTAMRAWIRRGLGAHPRARRIAEEHEMDWLADALASKTLDWWSDREEARSPDDPLTKEQFEKFGNSRSWSNTFSFPGCLNASPDFRTGYMLQGQRAVDIRRRLGSLTEWPSPGSTYATITAAAITKVMDTCLSDEKLRQFVWTFNIPHSQFLYQIRIEIPREKSPRAGGGNKHSWKDLSSEIESVLSLWLFDLKKRTDNADGKSSLDSEKQFPAKPQTRYRYILGPNPSGCLSSDIGWWMGHNAELEERIESYERVLRTADRTRSFGNRGIRDPTTESLDQIPCENEEIPTLSLYVTTELEQTLAHHLFSNFMWAIAQHVSRQELARDVTFDVKDGFNLYDCATWRTCLKMESGLLTGLIRDVQRTRLGTFEEVCRLIVPALSCADRLPSGAVIELVRKRVRDNHTVSHWPESVQVYSNIVDMAKVGVRESFTYKAVAAVVDFLSLATELDYTNQRAAQIEAIKKELLAPPLRIITMDIGQLYALQGRQREYDNIIVEFAGEGFNPDYKALLDERLASLFAYNPCHRALLTNCHKELDTEDWREYKDVGDVLGWTFLHYAMVRDPKFYETMARLLNLSAWSDPRDIAGCTPLHYSTWYRGWQVGQPLPERIDIDATGRTGMLPIHWAAKYGNRAFLRILIKFGSSLNIGDVLDRTPLFHAVTNGHEALARVLLKASADPNSARCDGQTVLHHAARSGDLRMMRLLLNKQWNVDKEAKGTNGQRALHYASEFGYREIAEALLNEGAKHSEPNNDGNAPIHLAAINDHGDIVRLLLGYNKQIDTPGAGGISLLHLVLKRRSPDLLDALLLADDCRFLVDSESTMGPLVTNLLQTRLLQVLLEHTRDRPGCDELKQKLYRAALEQKSWRSVEMLARSLDISLVGIDSSHSDLHIAAAEGSEAQVRLLIVKEKCDANIVTDEGETSLILAARYGHGAIVACLLENGAVAAHRDHQGLTALHLAARYGHTHILQKLLEADRTNIDAQDESGRTALIHAVTGSREDTVALLLSQNASVEPRTHDGGLTALALAVVSKPLGIIWGLLDHGADMLTEARDGLRPIDALSSHPEPAVQAAVLTHPRSSTAKWQDEPSSTTGRTALHHAAAGGRAKAVEALLDAGADVDLAVSREFGGPDAGATALHLAAAVGDVEVAEALLERGAQLDLADAAGRTALEIAQALNGVEGKDYGEIIDVLQMVEWLG